MDRKDLYDAAVGGAALTGSITMIGLALVAQAIDLTSDDPVIGFIPVTLLLAGIALLWYGGRSLQRLRGRAAPKHV